MPRPAIHTALSPAITRRPRRSRLWRAKHELVISHGAEWMPFVLAGVALVLGIPVYKRQKARMTEPGPVPRYPDTKV